MVSRVARYDGKYVGMPAYVFNTIFRPYQPKKSPTQSGSRIGWRSRRSVTTAGAPGGHQHHVIATAAATAQARMQAEQGSIGELRGYHNLRSRRHTLANVRWVIQYIFILAFIPIKRRSISQIAKTCVWKMSCRHLRSLIQYFQMFLKQLFLKWFSNLSAVFCLLTKIVLRKIYMQQ